jgi:hypothetical protein
MPYYEPGVGYFDDEGRPLYPDEGSGGDSWTWGGLGDFIEKIAGYATGLLDAQMKYDYMKSAAPYQAKAAVPSALIWVAGFIALIVLMKR